MWLLGVLKSLCQETVLALTTPSFSYRQLIVVAVVMLAVLLVLPISSCPSNVSNSEDGQIDFVSDHEDISKASGCIRVHDQTGCGDVLCEDSLTEEDLEWLRLQENAAFGTFPKPRWFWFLPSTASANPKQCAE